MLLSSVVEAAAAAGTGTAGTGTLLDGTTGLGGHTSALVRRLRPTRVVAVDRDASMLKKAISSVVRAWEQEADATTTTTTTRELVAVNANFARVAAPGCEWASPNSVDVALVDLGVNSAQLDDPTRGLSFGRGKDGGDIDMRMDRWLRGEEEKQELARSAISSSSSSSSRVRVSVVVDMDDGLEPRNDPRFETAKSLVNSLSEHDLGRVLFEFGEEPRWRTAARAIVSARQVKPIANTTELVDVLTSALGPRRAGQRRHPATLVFQALRVAVNRELEAVRVGVPRLISALKPGGRLLVISFHSLEDAIVKRAFDEAVQRGEAATVSRRPVTASADEVRENPRARSAKLRVLVKSHTTSKVVESK